MATVRSLLGNRKAWLACAALAVVIAVYVASMPSSEAVVVAGPGVWIYYNNASYATVVGARGMGCCGTPINWGVTSPFKKFEKIYGLDVLCPN